MYFLLKFFILRHTLYIYLLCTACARARACWVGEGGVDEVRVKNMRLKESDAYRFEGRFNFTLPRLSSHRGCRWRLWARLHLLSW